MTDIKRKSSYYEGRTVRQVAHDWLAGLDEADQETAYGADVRTVVRLTLAGGGPAAWIDFTFDGEEVKNYGSPWECEPLDATYTYSEGWGESESIEIDSHKAAELWQNFQREPVDEDE